MYNLNKMSLNDESMAISEYSRLETKASLNETVSADVNSILEEYGRIEQVYTENTNE